MNDMALKFSLESQQIRVRRDTTEYSYGPNHFLLNSSYQ